MAAAQPKAEAFLSYAHLDDRACGGQISRLREQLALSVSAALGREFEIFQDRDGIAWGQRWSKRLDEALGQALFLIPVLTPSYFNSKFCRAELEQFLELERGADRDDLILPIYFVTARPFEDRSDPLAAAVKDRQYRDWRNFWHRPIKSPGVMRAIAQLAREIEAAIHRSVPAVVGERISPARQDARGPSVLSLEDFKARLPIVDVVGRTVRLTRRGRQHLGPCPFHKEKTPSFYVYDDGVYHCFGCGAHGNAIDFVMATERLSFPDALRRLAELTGLPAPARTGEGDTPRVDRLGQREPAEGDQRAKPAAVEPPERSTVKQATPPYKPMPQPGAVFRDVEAPWCPELVVIPAGRFLMGSPADEEGRDVEEGPQHGVLIVASFVLGRYPVTFDEYDTFCAVTGREKPDDHRNWGRGRRPVIDVTWEDAQEYLAWLSQETGKVYRLPTEAEWEYACRAGTTTRYWWGDGITPERASYGRNVGRTTEVGSYPANPWELHDMHGNVWEWVEDRWHDSYAGAPNDGSAWLEGRSSARVARGGSWYSGPRSLRSACRLRLVPVDRSFTHGFRVARALTP